MAKFKDKERILKAAREKQLITCKGALIRLLADYATETLQIRREWQETFQVMKSKGLQPRLLHPARLSFKMEGKIRSFPNKRRLKEYNSTKPLLQKMLKGLKKIRYKDKDKNMNENGNKYISINNYLK